MSERRFRIHSAGAASRVMLSAVLTASFLGLVGTPALGNSDLPKTLYQAEIEKGSTPEAAFKTLMDAAMAGDLNAQFEVGECYADERGVKRNLESAVTWYKKAAEAGHAPAQRMLGRCYDSGTGVAKDATEAVAWYRKASAAGDTWAQRNLGMCYEKGAGVEKDLAEALRLYHLAADSGEPRAMGNLGNCFATGTGVTKSPSQAENWYKKAVAIYRLRAEAGDIRAQFNLGVCYANGEGVKKNPEEAVKWCRKAAEAGNSDAQYILGYCYAIGEGVEKNPEEAFRWYRKAAEAGDTRAQFNLGYCYANGEGVKKDPAEAVRWYRKAADSGNPDAANFLGFCYYNGEGVKKDPAEALRWYRKAAEAENPVAYFRLSYFYFKGSGVKKDLPTAVYWLKKGADAGHSSSIYAMGLYYDSGEFEKRDPAQAVKWYQLAALNGHKTAKLELERLRRTLPTANYQKGIAAANAWKQAREKPTSPPILKATATFEEPSGNRALDGDEKANLRITVKNTGKGASRQLRGAIQLKSPVAGLSIPPSTSFGDIEPGAERTVVIPLTGQRNLATAKATVEISLVDKYNFDAPLVRQTFETRAFVPPKFNVQLGVDDGNGNGLVERGEELTLKVVVKNQGGAARGVKVALSGPEGITWLGKQEQVALGDIPAGGWKQATFSCLVRNQYAGPESLPLKATITEARADLGGAFPVALTLNQAGPRVIEQVAQAKREVNTKQAPAPELNDPVDTAPVRNQRQPDAHAIIIGIERYANPLVPAVSFAKRDASIIKEYVTKTVGVPPENVRLLLDQEATLANLRTAISGQLANAIDSPKSKVYVYFAGHGAPNLKTKQPYLVPHDGNPAYPDTSCYPLSELYQSLGKLDVPVTVLLDACFSGATGRGDVPGTLVADARPALVELKTTSTPPKVSVLAAADGEQVSSGFSSKRHGLFTYFLLKGLGGEADTNRDNRLTLEELHRYVTPLVKRQARTLNREQTPTLQGKGEALLY